MQKHLLEALARDGLDPEAVTVPSRLPENFTAVCSNYRLFHIQGPDTNRFLQGQVTCNIDELTTSTSLTGAACTPKGRAYLLFRLLRLDDDHILMRIPEGIAEDVVAQLQKYLAFFKAEMTPADDWMILGTVGEQAAAAFTEGDIPRELDSVAATHGGYLVTTHPLPDTRPRHEFWLDTSLVSADTCTDRAINPQPAVTWHLSEIQSGLITLTPETEGEFVPQNLNLHATGGISFTKGCYTGQEVIARMHYLGQLKKSLFRLQIEGASRPVRIGDALHQDKGRKLGTVVDCVTDSSGTSHALAVLSHDVLTSAIMMGDEPDARVRLLPVSYVIPEQQGAGNTQ